jgi:hypothetical protein
MKIMYVGQGSGSKEFNTRVPSMSEHERMYLEFCKYVPSDNRFGYLLWSHSWADETARYRGNLTLTENLLNLWESDSIEIKVAPPVVKETLITKIKKIIRRIFR